MKTDALNFNNAALEAMQALRIQIELNEKINLRCKTTDELVQLLEIALRSKVPGTKEILGRFIENLSQRQATFFASVGVNLSAVNNERVVEKSYRGVKLQDAAKQTKQTEKEVPQGTSPNDHTGKRKVIYRGQVKWV